MVRAGYAWNYREYSVSPTLHDIETKAKEANAGLWSHDKPMAPWTWRKEQRAAKKARK